MKATSTKIGGIFLAVTGYVFGIASLVFVLLLCLGAVAAGWDLILQVAVGIFGVGTLVLAAMAWAGQVW